mgnify:CR=1 FL=1
MDMCIVPIAKVDYIKLLNLVMVGISVNVVPHIL